MNQTTLHVGTGAVDGLFWCYVDDYNVLNVADHMRRMGAKWLMLVKRGDEYVRDNVEWKWRQPRRRRQKRAS